MAYRKHNFAALIILNPKQARKEILEAFVKAKACRADAATILGCYHRTFTNWVDALGMRDTIDALERRAIKEGWHHGRNRVGRTPHVKKVA